MLTFQYKAKNISGKVFTGQLPAQHRATAVTALRQKNFFPLTVERQTRLAAIFNKKTTLTNRVSVKEKALFTRQLATLLKAGMQLTNALKTLSEQTQNKYLTTVIIQVYSDIEQSCSLSEAMGKHPKIFSSIYTAIIEAAEQSGALPETLTVLSSRLKVQAEVNSRIKSSLLYPVFLLVVSVMVVAVLMMFVIPKFIELFVNANQALPLPTKILIEITGLLKSSWWLLLTLIATIICIAITALKNQRFKFLLDSLALRLPLIGTLNAKLQLARFTRTLGSLLNGGVNILSAISTTKKTTNNTAFAKAIVEIKRSILKGSTLAKAMAQQKYFDRITTNMVAVGEDTGTLDEMLLDIAQMHEQESQATINSITTLLGPLMIMALGLIIGFVVMAILMPIFESGSMVG